MKIWGVIIVLEKNNKIEINSSLNNAHVLSDRMQQSKGARDPDSQAVSDIFVLVTYI